MRVQVRDRGYGLECGWSIGNDLDRTLPRYYVRVTGYLGNRKLAMIKYIMASGPVGVTAWILIFFLSSGTNIFPTLDLTWIPLSYISAPALGFRLPPANNSPASTLLNST